MADKLLMVPPVLLLCLLACQPPPSQPGLLDPSPDVDLDPLKCDLLYAPTPVSWHDVDASSGKPHVDWVHDVSGTWLRTAPTADQAQQVAWSQNARVWQVHLAPHPTRAPIRVDAVDNCPAMTVLPVATRVQVGGGAMSLADDGTADPTEWGADPGRSDLPWRRESSSVLRLLDGEGFVDLQVEPTTDGLSSWSPEVADWLLTAGSVFDATQHHPKLEISWSDVDAAVRVTPVQRADDGGLFVAPGLDLAAEVAGQGAGGDLPACAPAQLLGAGDPAVAVAAAWAQDLSASWQWPLGFPPPGDWSAWTMNLEPPQVAFRVHEPIADGACVARTVVPLAGSGGGSASGVGFALRLEVEVAGDAVVRVSGDGKVVATSESAGWRVWLPQAATQVGRDGDTPPIARLSVSDGELRLVLTPTYPVHAPIAVGRAALP